MRKIKFRGRSLETGELVYGDLIQGNYDECAPRIKPCHRKAVYVEPDSIAQLVTFDSTGNEVYEGDANANEFGGVITIRRVHYREKRTLKDEKLTRKIKYRGKATGRLFPPKGKLVSGYLSYSFIGDTWSILFEDANHNWNDVEVEPDSIRQFIGYDADGKEVYERDKVHNPVDGTTFKAAMNHLYTLKSYRLVES